MERQSGREYLEHQLVPSLELELLVDALAQAGKLDYCATGYVALLTTSGNDRLVVQELEPHVLMRLAYLTDDHTPVPDIEIIAYIDRHGAHVPLLVRGRRVGRAARPPQQRSLSAFADHLAAHLLQARWPEQGIPTDHTDAAWVIQSALQVTSEERTRIAGWLIAQGLCEATDGCDVPAYGRCPHGYQSWPAELGLI